MEDPLPAPSIKQYSLLNTLYHRKRKQFVAIIVCLFLGLTLIVCPYMGVIEGKPGVWILKLNSSLTQAPRGVFFGALAVLPQRTYLESVLSPQMWESTNEVTEMSIQNKHWLIMVWYGSSYV